tara:strand:+ start:814 stop:1161 length:348 start_codon:yes stop_codon:yes gene_type:complete
MTIRELLFKPIEWIFSLADFLSNLIVKIIRLQILDITLSEIGLVILLLFLLGLVIENFYLLVSEPYEVLGLFLFALGFFTLFCVFGEVYAKLDMSNKFLPYENFKHEIFKLHYKI